MRKPGHYVGLMDELRKAHGNKCADCGKHLRRWRNIAGQLRVNLQFMHIAWTPLCGRRRGRGRADRYHDIKTNAACYRLVCRTCHWKRDMLKPMARPQLPGEDLRRARGALELNDEDIVPF